MNKLILIFSLVIVFITSSMSDLYSFSGEGIGTISDPYQITCVEQLQEMQNDLSAYYLLMNDIDASVTVEWNSGEGFIPTGDLTNPFTGFMDGGGHTISGLFINRPGSDYQGLFGCTDSEAEIRDLGVINVNITGKKYIGGLVGFNNYVGTVSYCYATGTISGLDYVGGMVGFNAGLIEGCITLVEVTGNQYVGGLAGGNAVWVIGCQAKGVVNGVYCVGGVVGIGYGGAGTVSGCYATGDYVAGSSCVGGLMGSNNEGDVYDCAAYCMVVGENECVGGLVGVNAEGTVIVSDAYGDVIGLNYVGGLVGYSYGMVANCTATGDVQGEQYVGGLVGYGYGSTVSDCYAKGDIVDGSDFVGGLMGAGGATVSQCYATCEVEGDQYVGGLVGACGGTVNQCYATGNHVAGSDFVGGLIGINEGEAYDCAAYGRVFGVWHVGGLVGYNAGVEFFFNGTGTVENCYANGEVVGDQYIGGHIGGLVGYNASVVENCFATGAVSGNEWSGGLAGYNSGTLEKCYSIGEVSGNDYVGGLVGKNDGMVSNSFWDMDTGGMDNENGIGIGITTNSMKYYFTFYNAGWDFKGEDINGNDDIWNIGNNRNNGYPYQNWQYPYDDDPCFNPVFGGWIYAEQTICNNTIPEEFMSDTALSGYVGGPLEYKWQSSTIGATENYTDIAESNALTYASGNLVQTTWFKRLSRVTCKDSWNDAVESNVLKVTVRPELTPGSISSEGENVCSGDCPSVTIASTNAAIGGDGDISYQWQNCTNGSFSDPGIITENSDTYTPPSDLTTTTWYRRQAKDGTCSDWINSDGVWKVTVEDIPVAGTLTKDPDQDAINEGVDVSVTLAPGSGGNGTDELLARSNNGTEWTGWNSYTSGVAISTFGKTVVEIRTRRLANYCAPSEYLSVSWSVIPVHTLNITIAGNGIVEVGGEEYTTAITVTEGVMLNLEAIAAEGWLFNGWTGDVTDPAEAITTITMDTDKAITATFGPVSSSSIINLAEVVLFPNPFSSHISMSNVRGVERITITNIIGQCVLDVTLQNDVAINTNKLTAGVYLLTLHLANDQVEMKRMVKQ